MSQGACHLLGSGNNKCLLRKMATLREFLMSFISQYLIVVTGITALVALYMLSTTTRAFIRKDQDSKTDRASCSSPTCLRCSRRDRFREEELVMKLRDFACIRKTSEGDLTRLHKAIESNSRPTTTQRPTVFYLEKLTPQVAWHDSSYSFELEPLTSADNFHAIQSEFLHLYAHHNESWGRNSVPSGAWRVSHLYNQGKKVDKNCVTCPRTTKILESVVPFAQGCAFGNALFSVIEAGTHITAHCGPTNCRLRCHLALLVPECCGLEVHGAQRVWKEGQTLLFDDSFVHEAWHRGTRGYRAVLMVDLWHPGLSEIEKDAMRCLFPPLG